MIDSQQSTSVNPSFSFEIWKLEPGNKTEINSNHLKLQSILAVMVSPEKCDRMPFFL